MYAGITDTFRYCTRLVHLHYEIRAFRQSYLTLTTTDTPRHRVLTYRSSASRFVFVVNLLRVLLSLCWHRRDGASCRSFNVPPVATPSTPTKKAPDGDKVRSDDVAGAELVAVKPARLAGEADV